MNKLIYTLVISFFCYQLNAQKEPHRCYTVEQLQYQENRYPGFQKAVDAALIKSVNHAKMDYSGTEKAEGYVYDTTLKVEVVFHILYGDSLGPGNLTDAQIKNVLAILNADFNRKNADTNKTFTDHKPIVASSGIEFVLATKDPNCKPTTGIERKKTSRMSFQVDNRPETGGLSNDMKFDSLGGFNAWDTKRYYNIWVCNLLMSGGNGLLGFGQPPIDFAAAAAHPSWGVLDITGMSARTDGVVLDEQAVLTYTRVLTHETGHYFALRHIWGDKSGCSAPGDYVDDTPDQGDNAQGVLDCTVTRETCTEPSPKPSVADMIENYMSYSKDACMNAFSKGQCDVMRSAIKVYRTNLGVPYKVKGNLIAVKDPCAPINTAVSNNSIQQMTIAPVPAQSVIRVFAYLMNGNGSYQINIYNELGSVVKTMTGTENEIDRSIDISDLGMGVYHLELVSNGDKKINKFMKY